MAIDYRPAGFHALTVYLHVTGAHQLIDFLKTAFGATVVSITEDEAGVIRHAQLKLDDSVLEMSEARPEYPAAPVSFHFYVKDVDTVYQQALKAGGTSTMEPQDMYYGERSSGVKDPFGNIWYISTFLEELSPEELKRREKEWSPQK